MTCRTCKWLDVLPRKDGKIVPSKSYSYRCLVPIPELPPLPACIKINKGWNALKWPPSLNRMTPNDGDGCTAYELRGNGK